MKCQKCSFDNPGETRYCLHCGALILPPVPKDPQPQDRFPHKNRAWIVVVGVLVWLAGMSLVVTLVLGFIQDLSYSPDIYSSYESGESAETYNPLLSPHFSSDQDEKNFKRFVNAEKRTLRLPDSELTIQLPEINDFSFSYDEARQTLVMEMDTNTNQVVTITSSLTDTTPYTKSEAEEFERSGLYRGIEGNEDQYFYILSETSRTASGNIVDCKARRTTSVIVYDPYGSQAESRDYSDEPDSQQKERREQAAVLLEQLLDSTGLHN